MGGWWLLFWVGLMGLWVLFLVVPLVMCILLLVDLIVEFVGISVAVGDFANTDFSGCGGTGTFCFFCCRNQ